MGQKMSDIFFQYQDFSKSRYPGFFQNTFFARRVLSFLWLPGFFKIFSATGKSRYWRNFISTFLPVSGLFQKNPYSFQVESRYLVPEIQNTFLPVGFWAFFGYRDFSKNFRLPGNLGTGEISLRRFCPSLDVKPLWVLLLMARFPKIL